MNLCGVGFHHQNGVSERDIETVVWEDRVMILHAEIKWPNIFLYMLYHMDLYHDAHLCYINPRYDSLTTEEGQ